MLPFLASINWIQLILRILLSGAVFFVAFGTCFLIMVLIQKLSRMDFSRKHVIKLFNGGNVRSIYRLMVDAPDAALQFKVLMNGVPLGEIPVPLVETPVQQQQESTVAVTSQSKASRGKSASAGETKTKGKNSAVDGANQAGKDLAEKSGALASLLNTIGSLLPGSAGSALKEQGEAARSVQTKTTQTMQMPETAQNRVDALQKDSGRLGVKTNTINPPGSGSGNGNGKHPAVVSEPPQAQGQTAGATPPAVKTAAPRPKSTACYVETKEVAPGENLELTLWIAPLGRRSPEKSFTYILKSQQIPIEKLDRETPQVQARGVVHFTHVASWRYWLPSVLNGTIILIEGLSLVYFLTLIWL